MSKPQPNSAGQAYIESFEGDAGLGIPLSEAAWYYSSRPALGGQLPGLIGTQSLALNRATTMAFQNNGLDAAGQLHHSTASTRSIRSVRIVGGGHPAAGAACSG